MKIAVINSGSSSLKFKLFDMDTKELIYSNLIENIGEKNSKFKTHHEVLESLDIDFSSLDAIGHRVVHGGDEFHMPTIVDDEVLKKIKALIPLAPLHNPANIEGIEVACGYAPNIPQVAVFDTAFHFHMPREAYLYALPFEMYEKHKIRRYGFHGTSHSFVSKESAKILKKDLSELNLITLHLGNGASACAIQKGISIDTSMGFTPLEGLVMGTRSGDVDPAILIYMLRELGLSVDEVDKILNKKSGLLGICGKNDVRELINSKDKKSKLALDIMIRRVKKYIGSYMALLGDVDAIVFTGGIGENSSYVRDKILDSAFFERIKILVIKTDEELEIANECLRVLKK
ncbi:MAG: acetate kinase [Sulfurimonas sp.]|nr:acetate kinase [Sulfurimonas sp.]